MNYFKKDNKRGGISFIKDLIAKKHADLTRNALVYMCMILKILGNCFYVIKYVKYFSKIPGLRSD